MKLLATFKSPDAIFYALKEAGIDPNERPVEVADVLDTFVEFDEYVTIEFDTETGRATVIPS